MPKHHIDTPESTASSPTPGLAVVCVHVLARVSKTRCMRPERWIIQTSLSCSLSAPIAAHALRRTCCFAPPGSGRNTVLSAANCARAILRRRLSDRACGRCRRKQSSRICITVAPTDCALRNHGAMKGRHRLRRVQGYTQHNTGQLMAGQPSPSLDEARVDCRSHGWRGLFGGR